MKSKPRFEKHERNAKCSCGSGLKYKKCCWQQKMLEDIAKQQAWKKYIEEKREEAARRREAHSDALENSLERQRGMSSLETMLLAAGVLFSFRGGKAWNPRTIR